MKAVYLDYASLDQQDLDFQALHAVFDSLGEMGALLTQIADLEGVEKCHEFCSIIKT